MRVFFLAILFTVLMLVGEAAAGCVTHTIFTSNGQSQTCTTCCWGRLARRGRHCAWPRRILFRMRR